MPGIPTEAELQDALTARMGEKLQQRFAGSTVAICGLGGLGSNIAVSLARAGIGHLILADFDRVDISNLNRQQYKITQIGQPKPLALAENLREINPYLNITTHLARLCDENYTAILSSADLICEAFDKPEEKSALVNFVLEHLSRKPIVAASGMAGFGSANSITTRRVAGNFYLCGDGVSDVNDGIALFAPRVALCAAHQALTALRILAGNFEV